MPTIIKGSISILSDAGLGMAMFSLGICCDLTCLFCFLKYYNEIKLICIYVDEIELTGLFMALQPKIIACGKSVAAFSMLVRFLTGPAVIAATSIAIGVRGVLLHVAIVQVIH